MTQALLLSALVNLSRPALAGLLCLCMSCFAAIHLTNVTVEKCMSYFNNYERRQEIVEQNPGIFERSPSRVLSFVNLCIYPQKFEVVYDSIRKNRRLTTAAYGAVKGTILALLTLAKRRGIFSHVSVDHYVVDYISFIKNDSKSDPVKFLLNMKAYLYRYLLIRGLYVSFGLDWRELVAKALELKTLPSSATYHYLLTNRYVRNLLFAYVVWKFYYDSHEEGYEAGVNDVVTLLTKQAQYKKCISYEALVAIFDQLQSSLPSYNKSVRNRAAWAIDRALDGWYIVNKQMHEWKQYAYENPIA